MKFTYRGRVFDIGGVSQTDHIYAAIESTGGFYELDLLEYCDSMKRHWQPSEPGIETLAIDVGANIGNHSIFFRSFLADYVLSVEPNPAVLPVLRRNLENNIDRFTVRNCAVGEAAGRATIGVPAHVTDNVGMAKVRLDETSGDVAVATLDTLVENWMVSHPQAIHVALIKADVEGMELSVLRGGQKTLRTYRPHLLLEAATRQEFCELRNYLADLGYASLSRHTPTPVYHFCYQPPASLRLKAGAVKLTGGVKTLACRVVNKVARLATPK